MTDVTEVEAMSRAIHPSWWEWFDRFGDEAEIPADRDRKANHLAMAQRALDHAATHREAAARQARVEALREAQEAIGRVQKPLVARIDQEAIDFAIRAFAAIEALIAKDTTHDH